MMRVKASVSMFLASARIRVAPTDISPGISELIAKSRFSGLCCLNSHEH